MISHNELPPKVIEVEYYTEEVLQEGTIIQQVFIILGDLVRN